MIAKGTLSSWMILGLAATASLAAPPKIDSFTFGGLSARSLGPATMSGRISSLDGVSADPENGRPMTLWVGTASGGVWRSKDGGTTFDAVFDEHIQSIGAVRVDPSAPDTVWVGTGESWTRNSVSVGRGVYKTTNGGDSWQLLGLEDTERISAIRIDPNDGDTVYVCATGHLWNANEERGLYKTTDGGANWQKILYVDADTGCADIDLDPQDPQVVYAAMWQFRREPDFFTSGGPGSGLHRSRDGGKTWEILTEGMPEGDLGRIAVAVAPSRPSVVYATVEADKNALYRSDDVGETWTQLNASTNIAMRPFYFSELVVDPVDFRRVYKPGFFLTVSDDGGKSFSSILSGFGASIHPDLHALWIDPTNPQTMALGTDGGVYISRDRAAHWSFVRTLPVSQFYHVAFDNEVPYNVYGGLQDNGSWVGPSQAIGGILNRHWDNVGFGDGFWTFPHPEDSNIVFSEYQGGQLLRVNRTTGEVKSIRPYAAEGQEKLRFNWNTPLLISSTDPDTLYYGSQHLHISRDRGESWTTISPDLTTDDPALQRQAQSGGLTIDNSTAENHCSIFTIGESPVDPKVLWVGTDDGNVQLSRDGGTTWNELSDNIPDLPAGTWVSRLQASPHDAATVYATFDGHRRGDKTPYAYVSEDYGATWRALAGSGVDGYAHVIVQDAVNSQLLYLGTEMGLYISLDGGATWARFKENLPRVSVRDLAVHPQTHDLVIGTHGRGVYVIDDITSLRHLTPEILDAKVALVPNRPSVMTIEGQLQSFRADDEFVGFNPPLAATITYYLKKRHMFGDLKLEIYDGEGELLTTLPGSKRRGLNRIEWPMRLAAPKLPAATNLVPAFVGPKVPEGTYRVKLIKGKETIEGDVHLVPDPRSLHSAEDRQLQQKIALQLYHALSDLTYTVDSLESMRDAAEERSEGLRAADVRKIEAYTKGLEDLRVTLVSTSDAGMLSGEERLRERLGTLYGVVSTYDGRPSDSQLAEAKHLMDELKVAQEAVESTIGDTLADLNRLLQRRGKEPLERISRDAWEAQQDGSGGAATRLGKRQSVLLGRGINAALRVF